MLGQGLAVLIDLLNPERIILGSVYVRSKELLLDTMWEVLQRECLPKSLECCQILPSGLVRVAIQNFLKKPVISTVFKADE